ncbi:MAG: cobyrinate a,c-diamide synthase [Lachnospiraceae bacterium]|nr:cobyrinate a,c-diamide synthase [Lachnospiraceae bacterium]
MKRKMPRLLLAAPASGSGKTLITCGILQALVNRGLKVASFKCGPDYIDPMFHGRVIGTKSRNLDTFFTDEETTRYLFLKNTEDCEIALAEGVMGYYDGLGGVCTQGSTYEVACVLDFPTVLIVPCRGASLSILATVRGFLDYRGDSHIRAVILNQISPMIYTQLKPLLEEELGVRVLGYVPKLDDLNLESRHLGLVLPGEIEELREKLNRLAGKLEETLDLDALLALAEESEELLADKPEIPTIFKPEHSAGINPDFGSRTAVEGNVHSCDTCSLRIAVAEDDAFCFTYLDNMELLREMGAELVPFSPLKDDCLPEHVSGLILSGGYPELHAKELSGNAAMRSTIRDALKSGMPCIAECGGFLYLHRELEGDDGNFYPMAGFLDARAYRTDRLGRFGYINLCAREDGLLGAAGTTLRGHEFHYWESERCGDTFHVKKPVGKREWDCVVGNEHLYAGFPHLFLWSNPEAAYSFLKKCEEYNRC